MSAARKVFLAAEGPSEIGDLANFPRAPGKRRREGYLQPMLRKFLGRGVTFDGRKITVLRREDGEETGKVHIHTVRARMALALAMAEGCDAVVFAHDVDREQGVTRSALERQRRVDEMRTQIDAGFDAVKGADHVHRIKATPLRMIESWALGDADAVMGLAGKKASRASIPTAPEEAWGDKRDPASSYPKCILKRVLGREATAEDFADIAERSSTETLRRTCPVSFAPFADSATSAAAQLGLGPDDEPASSRRLASRRR